MLNGRQDKRISIYQNYFVFAPLFSKPILTRKIILSSGTLSGNRLNHSCRKTPFKNITNDDGDGNENGKKAKALDLQNKQFAHASRFFAHFLAVVVRLRRESA